MRRLVVAALMLAASIASWAQTYDPRVAYVTSARNLQSIVLANQDGARAVTVYSSKKALSGVDFAPGGGSITFSESGTLKVLAYTVSSSGIVVNGVTTLALSAGEPDFSPEGTKILYVGNMMATPDVREIPANGGTPRILMPNMSGLLEVAWFRSADRFVYLRQYESDLRYEVHLVALDPTSRDVASDELLLTTDSAVDFRGISDLDVARTKNSILLTLHYPTAMRVVEYNLEHASFTDHVSGARAHFSSDDSKIVYLDLDRSYVYSFDVVSGTTARLTKKGSFVWADARP